MQKQQVVDRLADFDDLVDWSYQTDAISDAEKVDLICKWQGSPAAASALKKVRQFRALLREIMEVVVAGKPFEETSIDKINYVLRQHNECPYLEYKDGKGQLKSRLQFGKPAHLLAPIAKSAAKLLSQAKFTLIKKMRESKMRDLLLRYQQEPKTALVQHADLRQQEQGGCSLQA